MSDITTRYELPAGGITLLGYVVRRMHKTHLLASVPSLLAMQKTGEALARVALYSVACATSYGRAYYQPEFNRPGAEVTETDPQTGAIVRAKLEATSPAYHITYYVTLTNGDLFTGSEKITGTTVGLRGLGMPAPTQFHFASGDYQAELTGILVSELAL